MVTLPIITASLIHAWIVMGGIDVISFDLLLHAYHLLLFNDPRRDFKRMIEVPKTVVAKNRTPGLDNTGKDEPTPTKYIQQSYPTNWSERLPWIGTLLISMRFIDWKIGTPSHDIKQPARHPHPPSHFRFISTAILRTITGYIVMDLTSAWTQQDPYFKTYDFGIDSALPPSTGLSLVPPRVLRSAVMALQVWATVGQQFQLPCILPVALHYAGYIPDAWSPHLWPPFFGSFTSIFTSSSSLAAIRGFWGRYWHQTLRFYCSSLGVWSADKLNLRRKSWKRYALLSGTTFFFSGVVHIGLVPREPMFAVESANYIRGLILSFFWLQPVGFAVEILASRGLRRIAGSRVGLQKEMLVVVNVVWFVGWCCLVLPLLGEAGRNLGYWRVWPVPVSLWKGVWEGQWFMWG
jgi:hypothetical protein